MENGDGMKSNEERVTLRSLVVEHALVVVALDMCASPPSRGCDECAPTTTTWLTALPGGGGAGGARRFKLRARPTEMKRVEVRTMLGSEW
jgi:hypothetical protein